MPDNAGKIKLPRPLPPLVLGSLLLLHSLFSIVLNFNIFLYCLIVFRGYVNENINKQKNNSDYDFS